jgi:hypothetical protein
MRRAEVIRRQNLLQGLMNVPRDTREGESSATESDNDIMEEEHLETTADNPSADHKKLRLQDLTEKTRKRLEKEVLENMRSSRKREGKNIIINDKTYHVECIIKYLHSCARFVLKNSFTNFFMPDSSQKSAKSITNKKLTRIFLRNYQELSTE